MQRVVGYARVSTVEQATEGASLDAQADRIKLWCQREGATLVSLQVDRGLSGRSDDRPGLQAALEACKRGDILIVYALRVP